MAFMKNLLGTRGERDPYRITIYRRGLASKLRIFPSDVNHEKEYANDKEVEKKIPAIQTPVDKSVPAES